MAFQASVVGENLEGSEQERGSAKRLVLWIVREENRGQADSKVAEFLFYRGSFFERYFEMPATRFEAPDLGAHGVGQGRIPAAKAYDYCFGIFSEDPK